MLKGCSKVTPDLFLLQAEKHNSYFLSLSSCGGAPDLWWIWRPSLDSPTSLYCCAEDPRAGCRTAGGVSESLPSFCCPHCFGCSLGHVWLSRLQMQSAGSCPASISPALSSPSQQKKINYTRNCHLNHPNPQEVQLTMTFLEILRPHMPPELLTQE